MRGLALALLLAACDGPLAPEVGAETELAVAACDLADSDPDADVTWEAVATLVIEPRCGCHVTPGGLGQAVTGLDLSTRDGALAGGRDARPFAAVEPGVPCESLVVLKTGSAPPFGFQMPLSGSPLTADERQVLVDWIAEGAQP